MQYNNYKVDIISQGDPGNAISSRFDLEPGSNAMAVGGIDSKFIIFFIFFFYVYYFIILFFCFI